VPAGGPPRRRARLRRLNDARRHCLILGGLGGAPRFPGGHGHRKWAGTSLL
jgi:hypothetical protein